MQPGILQIIYWLIAALHIAGILVESQSLKFITKPLLMVALGAYYFMATRENRTSAHWLVLTGFLFSWSGDINLMFVYKQEYFFLLGLVSFLITHILYIMAFHKDSNQGGSPRLLASKPYVAIPIIILYLGLLYILYDKIESGMKVAVIVYATIITAMVLAAVNRYDRVPASSFQLVLFGALLFMISDSMIAINKFYEPFSWASLGIMLTYITSQYLIARGTMKITGA